MACNYGRFCEFLFINYCVDVPGLVRLTWIQMLSVGLQLRLVYPTQQNFTALIKYNLESNLSVKSLIKYKKFALSTTRCTYGNLKDVLERNKKEGNTKYCYDECSFYP
jgi:hypothetical protein